RADGHDVRCLDTSVQPWDPSLVDWADRIAVSVPMHTAMRLAVQAARSVRRQRPDVPLCFYGLYAPVARDVTVRELGAHVVAGEYEPGLRLWVSGSPQPGVVQLQRSEFHLPWRQGLPPLGSYAHLSADGGERVVGYVEASHGCAHECRHCPVPVVYGGRIRTVAADVVLADIDQLVEMGASHITFGDPDFLNGWRHSAEIVRRMHERHPHLTFDVTTKVDHVLRHADLWPQLAASGCLFVVCALESVNDRTLSLLDKGHTTEQAVAAVRLLRSHGVEVRPSWMPFTPWTTTGDVADILEFVVEHDLIGNVDPVQYSIRLLVPEGSLLLDVQEIRPYLGPYDAERLTYTWRPEHPETDGLQALISGIVETGAAAGRSIGDQFFDIWEAVRQAAGRPPGVIETGSVQARPRLTEPWFC
ncbi:MAG TPA: radical SAM protein, partial [Actinomycetota bacterium]|nr:radical SAM protein [Actinomycetota bacterium]